MTHDEFIKRLNPVDTLIQHTDTDYGTLTVITLVFPDDIEVGISYYDKDSDDQPLCFNISHKRELLVMNALPMDELYEKLSEIISIRARIDALARNL